MIFLIALTVRLCYNGGGEILFLNGTVLRGFKKHPCFPEISFTGPFFMLRPDRFSTARFGPDVCLNLSMCARMRKQARLPSARPVPNARLNLRRKAAEFVLRMFRLHEQRPRGVIFPFRLVRVEAETVRGDRQFFRLPSARPLPSLTPLIRTAFSRLPPPAADPLRDSEEPQTFVPYRYGLLYLL